MQAEEAKRAGVQAPIFHSNHGGGTFVPKLDRKALSRAQKLHTKHGVAVSSTTNPANMETSGMAGTVDRASSISLGNIYGNEDNVQGTWGEMGYDGSTHNPMSGNGPQSDYDNRTSAGVDNTMVYDNQDMEIGGMQNYDDQSGYWAEDGQWYTYEDASGGAYRSSGSYGNNVDDSMAAGGSTHNPMADMEDNQVFEDEAAVATSSHDT